MTMIKLSEWAVKHNIAYITAYRWFKGGIFPVYAYQTDSGTILVEDESPTQQAETVNDAMSLFLKKTVEFSKNNATVEDFAAYVISNFSLKMNNGPESPRYSRQKPKSEDVQKHFQQFMPKGEKPKPNSFVMEPDTLQDLKEVSKPVSPQELVQDFKQAVDLGSVATPRNYASDVFSGFTTSTSGATPSNSVEAMSTEGTVTRNVDLSTPQQQINYTGSQNPTFSSSLTTSSAYLNNGITQVDTYCIPLANNGGIVSGDLGDNTLFVTGTNYNDWRLSGSASLEDSKLVGAFQPTKKELDSSKEQQTFAPKRRGRKPTAKR